MASPETNPHPKPSVEVELEAAEAPQLNATKSWWEVRNELKELIHYLERVNANVDRTIEQTTSEGEQQLSAAAHSMGVPEETFKQMRTDEDLDSGLRSIDTEAAALAKVTKEQISDIAGNDHQSEVVELEQARPPEEQKERMQDPRAALREAVTQIEQVQRQPESKIIPKTETARFRQYFGTKFETDTAILHDRWQEKGLDTFRLKIPEGGQYAEAIVFKRELPKEKMVRLYRGVNQMDDSLLDQTPYAMRAQGKFTTPMNVEGVRDKVNSLAEDPSYDNFIDYVSAMQPHLGRDEHKRMHADVMSVEDGILEGYSLRKELKHAQIQHGGGVSEHGVTPYISATFDPAEAAQYGRNGIMVIDIPLSKIEDFNANSGEVNIKGALGKDYITAILMRDRDKHDAPERAKENLERAIASVSEVTNMPLYNEQELELARQQKLSENVDSDKTQWAKDVERVRENRTKRLVNRFRREVGLDYEKSRAEAVVQGIDVYTVIKRSVYDHFADRLKQFTKGRGPEEYEYTDERVQNKSFDRNSVDDSMLSKLEEMVQQFEIREARRKRVA